MAVFEAKEEDWRNIICHPNIVSILLWVILVLYVFILSNISFSGASKYSNKRKRHFEIASKYFIFALSKT